MFVAIFTGLLIGELGMMSGHCDNAPNENA
jgi:hypothetical protein